MKCPGCGSTSVKTRVLKQYQYTQSGLDNVWLRGGVVRFTCPECKQQYTQILNEGQLLQVIATRLLAKPAALTGPEMRFLRKESQLTQAALAKRLQVARETIAMRESGRGITRESDFLLRAVILEALWNLLQDEGERNLSRGQMKELDDFRCGFTRRLLGMKRVRSRSLSLIHDREWILKAA